MADIHSIIRNIKSRNDLEANLKAYEKQVSADAYLLALNGLAFELITLAESLGESCPDIRNAEEIKKFYDAEIADVFLKGRELLEQFFIQKKYVKADEIEALRLKNRILMQLLTDAADLFSITEYVMNRIEHRFEGENQLPPDYSDLNYTQEILSKLSKMQNENQNLTIVRVAEQLPVRVTRSRFYDILAERLSVYRESDRSAFLNIAGLVRTTLGLVKQTPENPVFRDIASLYDEMRTMKLNDLDAETYREFKTRLTAAGAALNENMDFVLSVQEILNKTEAVLLTQEYGMDTEETKSCIRIIRNMTSALSFKNDDMDELYSQAYEACESLEGVIEQAQEIFTGDFGFYETIAEEFGGIPGLKKVERLMSNSSFAEDAGDAADEELSDQEYSETLKLLTADTGELFKNMNKQFVRASMGRLQSVLPPHFTSQEELEAFIFESLRSCTDVHEKLGIIEVVNSILEE